MNTKKAGHVYIIECDHGLIKIGMSAEPEKRIKNILNQSGLRLINKYVSKKIFSYGFLETKLHDEFADFRKVGEWFNINYYDAIGASARIQQEHAIKEADNVDYFSDKEIKLRSDRVDCNDRYKVINKHTGDEIDLGWFTVNIIEHYKLNDEIDDIQYKKLMKVWDELK